MKQTAWRSFLQLLGIGSSLSICQGAHGKKGKNTYHCVCVVRPLCNHNFTTVGGDKSSTRKLRDWRKFSVSISHKKNMILNVIVFLQRIIQINQKELHFTIYFWLGEISQVLWAGNSGIETDSSFGRYVFFGSLVKLLQRLIT